MHLKNLLPAPVKAPLKAAREAALDAASYLRPLNPNNPPRPLVRKIGDGDFRAVGEALLCDLRTFARLWPTDSVLDVGCGCGRLAMPLTRFLTTGCYEGFDIMPDVIEWCQTQIAPKHLNFRFQLADIYSKHYNPGGRMEASEFVFPYEDNSFDVVFLTSIFTHLLPGDVAHYLFEIERVLKPRGRCLATAFLLGANSRASIENGRATFCPRHEVEGGALVVDPDSPEAVVAHDEELFVGACYAAQLAPEVFYGSWAGQESPHSHDYVLLRPQVAFKTSLGAALGTAL